MSILEKIRKMRDRDEAGQLAVSQLHLRFYETLGSFTREDEEEISRLKIEALKLQDKVNKRRKFLEDIVNEEEVYVVIHHEREMP